MENLYNEVYSLLPIEEKKEILENYPFINLLDI